MQSSTCGRAFGRVTAEPEVAPIWGKGEVGRLTFPEVVYKHADLMAKITVKQVYVV
jgi:hypothetical protein